MDYNELYGAVNQMLEDGQSNETIHEELSDVDPELWMSLLKKFETNFEISLRRWRSRSRSSPNVAGGRVKPPLET